MPGLLDDHAEIVAVGKELKVIYRGMGIPFQAVPEALKNVLRDELEKDPKAQLALIEWGFEDPEGMLERFAWCRYGGSDFNPDVHQDGTLTPDYHECGNRGQCPFEGTVCLNPFKITSREREILILIAQGIPQKNIASELGIQETTVAKARRSLFEKTGSQSSVDLTRFALKHNYISFGL